MFVFDLLICVQNELSYYLLSSFHDCSSKLKRNLKENRKEAIIQQKQNNNIFKIEKTKQNPHFKSHLLFITYVILIPQTPEPTKKITESYNFRK